MVLGERSYTTDDETKCYVRLTWKRSADGTDNCVITLTEVTEEGTRLERMRQTQDRELAARLYLHTAAAF